MASFSTFELLPDNLPEESIRKEDRSRLEQYAKIKPRTSLEATTDLLAFGYSSTLFRDDETAARVDRGELLIPWQGETEEAILLDRFDVRNLLDSRDSFRKVKYTLLVKTSEAEEERLCDIERYGDVDSEEEDLWDMSEDERNAYVEDKKEQKKEKAEKIAYRESLEAKRLKRDYEIRVPIPDDMEIPNTRRHFSIIEKTAKFLIDSPTTQNMEITIQTKQANNPDFAFLNVRDALYPFYVHISTLLRSGDYVGVEDAETKKESVEHREIESVEPLEIESVEHNEIEVVTKDCSLASDPKQKLPEFNGVCPPPHIKAIIDRTADFVARSGPAFEKRLRERNSGDSRFEFLLPLHKFYPYWNFSQQQVAETKSSVMKADPILEKSELMVEATDGTEAAKYAHSDSNIDTSETLDAGTATEPKTIALSPIRTPPDITGRTSSMGATSSGSRSSSSALITPSLDPEAQARRRKRVREFLARRNSQAEGHSGGPSALSSSSTTTTFPEVGDEKDVGDADHQKRDKASIVSNKEVHAPSLSSSTMTKILPAESRDTQRMDEQKDVGGVERRHQKAVSKTPKEEVHDPQVPSETDGDESSEGGVANRVEHYISETRRRSRRSRSPSHSSTPLRVRDKRKRRSSARGSRSGCESETESESALEIKRRCSSRRRCREDEQRRAATTTRRKVSSQSTSRSSPPVESSRSRYGRRSRSPRRSRNAGSPSKSTGSSGRRSRSRSRSQCRSRSRSRVRSRNRSRTR